MTRPHRAAPFFGFGQVGDIQDDHLGRDAVEAEKKAGKKCEKKVRRKRNGHQCQRCSGARTDNELFAVEDVAQRHQEQKTAGEAELRGHRDAADGTL